MEDVALPETLAASGGRRRAAEFERGRAGSILICVSICYVIFKIPVS